MPNSIPPDDMPNFEPVCFLKPHRDRTGLWVGMDAKGNGYALHRCVGEEETFVLRRCKIPIEDAPK